MEQNPGRPVRHGSAHRANQYRANQARVATVLPYLLVLAAVVAGLLLVFQSSKNTVRGTGLIGCALLVAALARLALPPRYAGALGSRHKAIDVAAFVVLGGAVLGLALSLPQ